MYCCTMYIHNVPYIHANVHVQYSALGCTVWFIEIEHDCLGKGNCCSACAVSSALARSGLHFKKLNSCPKSCTLIIYIDKGSLFERLDYIIY